MRNAILRNLFALLVLITAGAFAQTTGTVTLTGTIPDAVSLTNSSDTALSTTLTLGALVATNNTTLAAIAPLDVHLRSNKQYKLNASMVFTNAGNGTPAGGDSIADIDIGFGITAVVAPGANGATGRAADTITTKFDYTTTAMSALSNPTGTTPFVSGTNGTLHDIVASTQVVTGARISKKGNIITPDNFLKLTFGAATLPQYFTPTTGFQAVVTLTVVTF
jgi:hypothetical protein